MIEGAARIKEDLAASLAMKGFVVFSLAFFKEKGLPPDYSHVKVEYFERAIDLLQGLACVKGGGRDQRDWVYSLETEIKIFFYLVSILRLRLLSCSLNYETETEIFFFKVSTSRPRLRLYSSSLEIETETAISLKIKTETFSRFLYTFGIPSLEFQACSKWKI